MANTGTYKNLPWPHNLWAEVYGCGDRVKPPEDWQEVLPLFTDTLDSLEMKILYGWYQDRKTATQLEAELNCPHLARKKTAIVFKMRKDRKNYKLYRYGIAKTKLMPSVCAALSEGIGMSREAAEALTVEIATSTSIAQMTSLEHELSSVIYTDADRNRAVENILNKYGLTMLKTRKTYRKERYRAYIVEDALEIMQKHPDREILAEWIIDTLRRDISQNAKSDQLIPAFASFRIDSIIKALTGGDMLSLLCRAGVVILHESEDGACFWGEVQRTDTLQKITEEENI